MALAFKKQKHLSAGFNLALKNPHHPPRAKPYPWLIFPYAKAILQITPISPHLKYFLFSKKMARPLVISICIYNFITNKKIYIL
jgi:hypothetical protein